MSFFCNIHKYITPILLQDTGTLTIGNTLYASINPHRCRSTESQITMLQSLHNTRQIAGEPKRQWFMADDLDLVVWFEPDETICAFQLTYDRNTAEHALLWRVGSGYRHYEVNTKGRAVTPLLYANGPFKRDAVLAQFLSLSGDMPEAVVAFIAEKLRDFDGLVYT